MPRAGVRGLGEPRAPGPYALRCIATVSYGLAQRALGSLSRRNRNRKTRVGRSNPVEEVPCGARPNSGKAAVLGCAALLASGCASGGSGVAASGLRGSSPPSAGSVHESDVWPGLRESDGEPLTCGEVLRASRWADASLSILAPRVGSHGSLGRRGSMGIQSRRARPARPSLGWLRTRFRRKASTVATITDSGRTVPGGVNR